MLKIGRYRIAFGWACWFQTHVPTTVRRLLWLFWFIREARPEDIDKKQRFPPGTPMVADGTKYRYYKAGKDIVVGGEGVVGADPGRFQVTDSLRRMQENTVLVCEKLGISTDDYMMFYWDFSNDKVMAIDHLGKHSVVGDIYDVVIKDECVVSFKIRRCKDHVNTS